MELASPGRLSLLSPRTQDEVTTDSILLEDPPLHAAVQSGSVDEVARLIAEGADVDALNTRGNAPLHLWYSPNFEATAALLLDAGADIDKTYVDKRYNVGSPLLEAAGDTDPSKVASTPSSSAAPT